MTKSLLSSLGLVLGVGILMNIIIPQPQAEEPEPMPALFWEIQSIDTMKYSRDLAREKMNDQGFDQTIDGQVAKIASTNATHVAIGTPYDPEFLPMLTKWVNAARRHGLGVWFRGNQSGWEGWFGYPEISGTAHAERTTQFVERNMGLFRDGDVFDPCPECENGGLGDPRQTGDANGYRNFLIDEYGSLEKFFQKNGLDVRVVFSMNGDVAKLVMNKDTVRQMGNVITVDHYVRSPEDLATYAKGLAEATGAKILIGEFGFPIPDLHGDVPEEEQKNLVESALAGAARQGAILGINYWVSFGGSTALWDDEKNVENPAINAIKAYFQPNIYVGHVTDAYHNPIRGASISTGYGNTRTDSGGKFQIPLVGKISAQISASGYYDAQIILDENFPQGDIALTPSGNSTVRNFFQKIRGVFR
jgi:hypothetical protein